MLLLTFAVPAASAYEIVLALHIIAMVVAFGATFIYPVMFAVGARRDPRSLPLLHRVEYTIEPLATNAVTFDIEVPEDDLEGVTTVGHAVDLVLTKVGS